MQLALFVAQLKILRLAHSFRQVVPNVGGQPTKPLSRILLSSGAWMSRLPEARRTSMSSSPRWNFERGDLTPEQWRGFRLVRTTRQNGQFHLMKLHDVEPAMRRLADR